ncbi:beta strand repeat-containing protein [Methylobacterium sp. Leaf118]|uniref:beta strand repeat-containing protein n=1 Tax=Methylobacterium sp. Leaf118 TaxID=2876562 RepID=UPI001E4B9B19|nr:Ig-like domain-containing protein [Methylobacterium sp. Leaf118]
MYSYGNAVALQGDGKIVVSGSVSGDFGSTSELAVVRYNADGSLDTSFGSGGKVRVSVGEPGTSAGANAVTIQADGKIVVSGSGNGVFMSGSDFAVVRFNVDGTLDTGFGVGGKVLTDFNPYDSDAAFDVVVQIDGKIVVSGYSNLESGGSAFAMARYNVNGTLDTSFGSGGKIVTAVAFDPPYDLGYSLALQTDGKIVVSGYSYDFSGGGQDFALIRYNIDGSLDTNFGAGGKVVTPVGAGTASDTGRAVTIQADGKILVAGLAGGDFGLVRYNVDGSLDTSFGTNGKVLTPVGTGFDVAYDVVALADGTILVSGYAVSGPDSEGDFAVVRYKSDGALDTAFGSNGRVLTPVGPGTSSDNSYGMVVQADGKIVVSGYSAIGGGSDIQFAVVRYNANGTLDTSFGGSNSLGGTVGYTEKGTAVVLDADVDLSDPVLDVLNGGLGDYAGASLTLARLGGAHAQDVFAFAASSAFSVVGNELWDANGDAFATVDQADGEITLNFIGTNIATSALFDAVARAITYANSSDQPPASVSLGWSYLSGAAGGDGTASGTSTVTITAVNDAPTATPSVSNRQQRSLGGESNFLFSDPNGDTLTLARIAHDGAETMVASSGTTDIAGSYGTLTVQANGRFRYAADQEGALAVGETQTDTFTFTMRDPGGLEASATYKINVTGSATGNAGNNIFKITDSGRAVDGGGGTDTVSFDRFGTSVRLTLDGANDGTIIVDGAALGTVRNVENVVGSAYADVLAGDGAANRLSGGMGNDLLVGGAGNDRLEGDEGDDVLEGGEGADSLEGGSGTNTASYASAATGVTADLGAIVAGTGDAAGDGFSDIQNLTGSAFDDILIGNADANRLTGNGGADTLIGRAGNDTYFVDESGDQVIEAIGGGRDTVATTVSYALAAGQEIEELCVAWSAGDQAINLTGNEFAQILRGNGGVNVLDGGAGTDTLDGGAGADILIGGTGSDTYIVDNAGDQVIEAVGAGWDAVAASVSYTLTARQEIEELRVLLSAGDQPINLTGNTFAQTVIGNNGANVLDGGWGKDVLTGRGGADTFLFNSALGTNNVDRITDFASEDTIGLSRSIFKALATGELDPGRFKNITTGTADADDRILYKQSTGELFYDADGLGSRVKVKFAVLDHKPALTSDDFFIV